MIEIVIPETLEIGGFNVRVEHSEAATKELQADNHRGDYTKYPFYRIRVSTDFDGDDLNDIVIHEFLEGVNDIYCICSIEHDDIVRLATGLNQVFRQLGIRFVLKED